MRRRRVGRCLLRADLALDDGDLTDARMALDEARELGGEFAELAVLEARFHERQNSAVDSRQPRPDTLIELTAVAVRLPGSRRTLVAAAGALALIAVASYWYWADSSPSARPAPAPTLAPATVSAAAATEEPAGIRVVQETVITAPMPLELVPDEPVRPSIPPPPIAAPDPPPVVAAVNRRESATMPTLPQLPRSDLQFEALASVPPPEVPANPPAIPAPITSPSASAPLPMSRSASRPADESSVVRSVLARYERAYNSLDATAASAVWPAVDRHALARAFEGLSSQRVSLQACAVTVTGVAAHAICSGTAMWVPKVGGGGTRTAARRWNFELRKAGDAWQIQRAITR
jgi:hypothetical protein